LTPSLCIVPQPSLRNVYNLARVASVLDAVARFLGWRRRSR